MDQPASAVDSTSRPKKILVIDDDDTFREIIRMTLELSAYEVFDVRNGLDGLAAVKIHRPDLILCDINMPEMNGHAVLAALKKEPGFAGTPFIFLTGNAQKSDMRKGMQLGADDYLTKPFTNEELLAAVQTRLSQKHSLQKYYESQFDDIRSSILRSLPHEFRTPLNGIIGFSQVLQEENGLPDDEVHRLGALIQKSGERLGHLLENMVLFGRLQFWMHDQAIIEKLRYDAASTLLDIVQSVAQKQMAAHKRPDAILLSVKNCIVQVSTEYLIKIIEELVANALKFSDAGSKVHISSEENDTQVFIIVRDEGRGMSQEQVNKISVFQQFERRYYEQQGAGLGLVLAKLLVELHGGSLSIESVEKNGTTVTVCLPKISKE